MRYGTPVTTGLPSWRRTSAQGVKALGEGCQMADACVEGCGRWSGVVVLQVCGLSSRAVCARSVARSATRAERWTNRMISCIISRVRVERPRSVKVDVEGTQIRRRE